MVEKKEEEMTMDVEPSMTKEENKCFTEDEVGLQFPSTAFDFQKPKQGLSDDYDVLASLPCRIIQNWKLHHTKNDSTNNILGGGGSVEESSSTSATNTSNDDGGNQKNNIKEDGGDATKAGSPFRGCVSLPIDTESLQGYVLIGTLKPVHKEQSPIEIKLDKMEYYVMDKSKGYRGYWAVTPTARYWLQQPSTEKVQIQRLKVRVDGEIVDLESDESSSSKRKNEEEDEVIELASQDELHTFHRAQLGLFSNLLDTFLPNNGETSYMDMLSQSTPKELYTMLSPSQEKIKFYNDKMKKQSGEQEQAELHHHPFDLELLSSTFQFLQRQVERFDPNMKKSNFFKAAIAASKPIKASASPSKKGNSGAGTAGKNPVSQFFTESQLIDSAKAAEVRSKQYPWGESLKNGGASPSVEHFVLPKVNLALPLEVELMFQAQKSNVVVDGDDEGPDDHNEQDDAVAMEIYEQEEANKMKDETSNIKSVDGTAKNGSEQKQGNELSSPSSKKPAATASSDDNSTPLKDRWQPPTVRTTSPAASIASDENALKKRWRPPAQTPTSTTSTTAAATESSATKEEKKALKDRWQPPAQTPPPKQDEMTPTTKIALKDRWQPPTTRPDDDKKSDSAAPPSETSGNAKDSPSIQNGDERGEYYRRSSTSRLEDIPKQDIIRNDETRQNIINRRLELKRLRDEPADPDTSYHSGGGSGGSGYLDHKEQDDYDMQSPSNKKYKLYSSSSSNLVGAPEGRSVCSFFNTPRGCRNGANCKFLHISSSQQDRISEDHDSRYSDRRSSQRYEDDRRSSTRYEGERRSSQLYEDDRRSSQRFDDDARRPNREDYRSDHRANDRVHDDRPDHRSNDRTQDERNQDSGYARGGDSFDLLEFRNKCWGCGAADHVYFDKAKKRIVCPRQDEPEVKAHAESVHQEFKKRQRQEDEIRRAGGRDDTRQICSYFLSSRGCRNGSNCKFLHADPSSRAASANRRPEQDELAPRYGDHNRNETKGYRETSGSAREYAREDLDRYGGIVRRSDNSEYDARGRADSRRSERQDQSYLEQDDPRRARDYGAQRDSRSRDSAYGDESWRHQRRSRSRSTPGRESSLRDGPRYESDRQEQPSRFREQGEYVDRSSGLSDRRASYTQADLERQRHPEERMNRDISSRDDRYADSYRNDSRLDGRDTGASRETDGRGFGLDDRSYRRPQENVETRFTDTRHFDLAEYKYKCWGCGSPDHVYYDKEKKLVTCPHVDDPEVRAQAEIVREELKKRERERRDSLTVDRYANDHIDSTRPRYPDEANRGRIENDGEPRREGGSQHDNLTQRFDEDSMQTEPKKASSNQRNKSFDEDGEVGEDGEVSEKIKSAQRDGDITANNGATPMEEGTEFSKRETVHAGALSGRERESFGDDRNGYPDEMALHDSFRDDRVRVEREPYQEERGRVDSGSFRDDRDRRHSAVADRESFRDHRGAVDGETLRDGRDQRPSESSYLDRARPEMGVSRDDRELVEDRRRPSVRETSYDRDYADLEQYKNQCWGCDSKDHVYYDKQKKVVTCPYSDDPEVRAKAEYIHQLFIRRAKERADNFAGDRYANDSLARSRYPENDRADWQHQGDRDRNTNRLYEEDTRSSIRNAEQSRYERRGSDQYANDHEARRQHDLEDPGRGRWEQLDEVNRDGGSGNYQNYQEETERAARDEYRSDYRPNDRGQEDRSRLNYSELEKYKHKCWGCGSPEHVYYDKEKRLVMCPRADEPEIQSHAEFIHQEFKKQAEEIRREEEDASRRESSVQRYEEEPRRPANDDTRKICAFFLSPNGCRKGSSCRFLHTTSGDRDQNSSEGGTGPSRRYEEDNRRPDIDASNGASRDYPDLSEYKKKCWGCGAAHHVYYDKTTKMVMCPSANVPEVKAKAEAIHQLFIKRDRDRYGPPADASNQGEYSDLQQYNNQCWGCGGVDHVYYDKEKKMVMCPRANEEGVRRKAEAVHQGFIKRAKDRSDRSDDRRPSESQRDYVDLRQYSKNQCWGCGAVDHVYYDKEKKMVMCPRANEPEVRRKAETVHQGFIQRAKDRSGGPDSQDGRYIDLQDYKNKCWGCDAVDHVYFDKEKNMVTCPRANEPGVRGKAAAVHQEFKKRAKDRFDSRPSDRYANDRTSSREYNSQGFNESRRDEEIPQANPRFRREDGWS